MPSPNKYGVWALSMALGAAIPAGAQEVSLHVQRSVLAGYRYHHAPELVDHFKPGEALDLLREAENPHDSNAVRVEWHGYKLGYVPRAGNAALAWAMDRGESVSARVAEPQNGRHPRARIQFDIFLR